MENLWSPWRSQYISTFKHPDKESESCFLCEANKNIECDNEDLVVCRQEHSFAILNKFPYNNGHTLVAPIRHIGEFDYLTDYELIELTILLKKVMRALKDIYSPHGFNMGINIGRAAGAGLPGHLHYHIVPRWVGDTNFMTVVADTKVISESLLETKRLLSDLLK